jgi:hypothetical protein
MNPYLEPPTLWSEVHKRLIVAIADALFPKLRPKYRVAIEERIYQSSEVDSLLVGIPDVVVQRPLSAANPTPSNVTVASPPVKPITITIPMPETVREGYLEVRNVATREVVTAIEVLSPKNKRAGEGRKAYKRSAIGCLGVQLIWLKLIYCVLANQCRFWRMVFKAIIGFWLVNAIAVLPLICMPLICKMRFPSFPLPLRKEDTEPLVDLQELLNGVYDRAGYDLVIDYNGEPVPSLSITDAAWADAWLREKGLR